MSKSFSVEFERLDSGVGILDLALRFNPQDGEYEFVIEENGIPITVPFYQFAGMLQMLITHSGHRFWNGYTDKEESNH